MGASRLACLLVPLFPLAARLRSEPELIREALAVLAGSGTAARVVAATRLARRAGIRPGQTLAQARALMPRLIARARDEECERAAQEALFEVAESFSPRVEDAGEGLVYLDADGLEWHFPGEFPERDLGRAILCAADACGLPARVGIASSKLAARVAAAQPSSPTVVAVGEEASFLAPLPLSRLSPALEIATTLHRWGLKTVGDLARLPDSEIASRLGADGRALHTIARGLDPRPLMPRQPPPSFREGMSLEWPLVALEPFLFVARAALERVVERLAARGLSCRRLDLSLQLEPDGFHQRGIDLPAPTREVKTLLTLVRLELEARPHGAPVVGFHFDAHPDRPRQAQLSLFGPEALSPDRLAATLARLFALLGPDRVGSPRPADEHRPEGFALVEYNPPPPPEVRREPPRGHGLLAVRVLRPPLPLEVLVTGEPPRPGDETPPDLRLLSVRSLESEETAKRPRLHGRVRVASGPWELEEQWWNEGRTERDYWDVELSNGGVYRLYRDRPTGEWFADGVYD
ncbi:MAG: DNA polymerase Y family protein [Acidobacteria bacterium]|nr:DNA polymerase Y family protein [Acidobacteriota bacterium]